MQREGRNQHLLRSTLLSTLPAILYTSFNLCVIRPRLTSDFLNPHFGSFVCSSRDSSTSPQPSQKRVICKHPEGLLSTSSIITLQFLFMPSKLTCISIHSWSRCLRQQASNSSLNPIMFFPMSCCRYHRSLMVTMPWKTMCKAIGFLRTRPNTLSGSRLERTFLNLGWGACLGGLAILILSLVVCFDL